MVCGPRAGWTYTLIALHLTVEVFVISACHSSTIVETNITAATSEKKTIILMFVYISLSHLLSDTLVADRLASWRADTGTCAVVKDLRERTRIRRAAITATDWNGKGKRDCNGISSSYLPLPNRERARSPVAEAILVLAVWARSRFHTPFLISDVAALLAFALEMVQVSDCAETNLPPAAPDEFVDKHTSGPPDSFTSNTGRVLAIQVVAGATIDWWPVKYIGWGKKFLQSQKE